MAEKMQERKVVGLDVHPYMFSASAVAGSDALNAREVWMVDRLPLERIEEIIKKRTTCQDVLVMEASGNSFAVAERIAKLQRTVIVLESQSVGKVGKTYCATDRTDALKIARVYLSGLAHIVWTPDPKSAERRELFFAHRNAVKDATKARNRIWAFLNGHAVKRPKGIRLSSPDALSQLKALHVWTDLEVILITDLLDDFLHAESRRRQFRRMIAEEVTTDPQILKLIRLLGIRDKVAFALAAFIGDVNRFASPRKLVAYFGLNPIVSRSGISGGNGGLSCYGRADVRALLIQSAQSIMRHGNGPTHKWAVALKMRKGTNIAVAALARKLVVSVWYLLKGMFTPLVELHASLLTKIHKIATEIGKTRILELGFQSVITFERNIHEKLLQTT